MTRTQADTSMAWIQATNGVVDGTFVSRFSAGWKNDDKEAEESKVPQSANSVFSFAISSANRTPIRTKETTSSEPHYRPEAVQAPQLSQYLLRSQYGNTSNLPLQHPCSQSIFPIRQSLKSTHPNIQSLSASTQHGNHSTLNPPTPMPCLFSSTIQSTVYPTDPTTIGNSATRLYRSHP